MAGSKGVGENGAGEEDGEDGEAVGEEGGGPELPSFSLVCSLTLPELGLPPKMYTAGNLCHPYLSLPYLDVLTQPSSEYPLLSCGTIIASQNTFNESES